MITGISDAPQPSVDTESPQSASAWVLDAPAPSRDWITADQIPAVPDGAVANFVGSGSLGAVVTGVPGVGARFEGVAQLAATVQAVVTVAAQFTAASATSGTGGVGAHLGATTALSATSSPAASPNFAATATLSAAISGTIPVTAPFAGSATLAAAAKVANAAAFAGAGTAAATVVPGVAAQFAGSSASSATTSVPLSAGFSGSGTPSATAKIQVSDTFTRANGALGSNWTGVNLTGTAGVVPVIASNAFAPGTATADTQQVGMYSAQALGGSDQRARATISGTISGTLLSGIVIRSTSNFAAGGGSTPGVIAIFTSSNTYIFSAATASSWTQRATVSYSSWTPGDVVELRAIGNVYSLVRNPDTSPVTVLTWTDSGGVVTVTSSMRYCGLYVRSNSGGASSATWQNFVARDN